MFSAIALFAAALALVQVNAETETHTITFTNNCGSGTPYLRRSDGYIWDTGTEYPFTINAGFEGSYAYLQTGSCSNSGEGCTVVELSLENGNSSVGFAVDSPYEFSVATSFNYYDGCDGIGADCNSADCSETPVGCSAVNGNLAITFCPLGSV